LVLQLKWRLIRHSVIPTMTLTQVAEGAVPHDATSGLRRRLGKN
jgi:hypothetical protein